ncbi:hypothetical protein M422DRAFT_274630 [Sphaerobolus stellatus SS14]|uniref:Choline/carnitine acyltransferase domain-containing protein n=1 Tax=Sphaerobolus stellatus (strain SS14) TaxID=990650 RepID=A0A0C9T6K6_SPHS4|nr:hypothetical protein M422DRAFT_274630 [Sphaerobolus stellatus SS14]
MASKSRPNSSPYSSRVNVPDVWCGAPCPSSQIEIIIQLAGEEKAIPIGALTSENRDTWTEAREALLKASPSNAAALERIESAIIVVALDDTKPNRFYDKHQLIVFDNGRSGFLGEHSHIDGAPTLRLNEFTLASLTHNKLDHGSPTIRFSLPTPKELIFTLDTPTKRYISAAESNFDTLVNQHDLHVLHYEGYSKDLIKKFKASPDAWMQLCKQLAFQKMFNRPPHIYENCQTRKFKLGHTELIRSASNESKAWVEAMVNPDETDANRAALFRKAISRHHGRRVNDSLGTRDVYLYILNHIESVVNNVIADLRSGIGI